MPTPTPETAAPVEPPAPPVVHGVTLRVAAFREGGMLLSVHGDALVTWLDGEPWSWGPTGPTREPSAGRGLHPIDDRYVDIVTTSAVGRGTEELPAWQTMEWIFPRMGSSFTVHHREADRWNQLDLRDGRLVAYYADYVEREGALLALQAWAPDPEALHYLDDGESEPDPAYGEALTRSERSQPTWIQLAGPSVRLPDPPPMVPRAPMITTSDGTLYAIVVADHDPQLLRWPARSTEYERVAVPGLGDAESLGLAASGEWVVLSGLRRRRNDRTEPYLVVGRGDEWTRVATPRWKADDPDLAAERVLAAARAPDGELWVALGIEDGYLSSRPLWRRPPAGAWESVRMPPFPAFEPRGASSAWAYVPRVAYRHDQDVHGRLVYRWDAVAAPTYDDPPTVGAMAWASGALWITVAQAHRTHEAFTRDRTMLLTTHVGEDAPVELAPSWQLQLEHRNEALRTAAFASRECRTFSLVLGPASLATTEPELVRALHTLRRPRRSKLGPIYTGSLDGSPVLVAYAEAPTSEAAHALRDAVAATMGLEVKTDCRKPLMETLVSPKRAR